MVTSEIELLKEKAMKLTLPYFSILAGFALMTLQFGCAGPKATVQDVDMESARATAKTECNRARSDADIATVTAIGKLPKEQQGMALMGHSMQMMAAHLSPKDPCNQGMNFNEARTAIAKSQNETITGGLNVVAPVAGSVAIVNSVTKFGAKAMERAGNQTTTNITGDENSANHEHVQTTSNNTTDISSDGEGSAPSVSNGGVNGPDQSSTTETIHEAPAVPVVEE